MHAKCESNSTRAAGRSAVELTVTASILFLECRFYASRAAQCAAEERRSKDSKAEEAGLCFCNKGFGAIEETERV
jgi:hypothetical protein